MKLITNVGSGQMYHVYRNQAVALICPFISSFFFPIFNIEVFSSLFSGTVRPRRLKLGGQWADVSCIPEAGCCCLFVPLFLHFSFSPIFNIEIFRHTFLGNCEALKIEKWADVSCVPESGCCCLFIPLFLHFTFSPIFNIEIFHHTFLRNCEA